MFRFMASTPMSDTSNLFIILLLFFLVLKAVEHDGRSRMLLWFFAGTVFGFAVAIRVIMIIYVIFIVLTAIMVSQKSAKRFFADMVPCGFGAILWGVAIAWYNNANFGSPFRSGYAFWASSASESLARNFGHISLSPFKPKTGFLIQLNQLFGLANAQIHALMEPSKAKNFPGVFKVIFFIATYVLWLVATWGFLAFRKREADKPVARVPIACILGGVLPLVVTAFLFFYKDDRFYLPVLAIVYLFVGVGLVELACSWRLSDVAKFKIRFFSVLAAVCVLIHVSHSLYTPRRLPINTEGAHVIEGYKQLNMPDNAVLVTDWDQVLCTHYLVRGTNRECFPFSRQPMSLYARAAVFPKRPPDMSSYPDDIYISRFPALFKLGGKDIFPETAVENPEKLAALIKEGRPVYSEFATLSILIKWIRNGKPHFVHEKSALNMNGITSSELQSFYSHFNIKPVLKTKYHIYFRILPK
jgi:hypothetical protein